MSDEVKLVEVKSEEQKRNGRGVVGKGSAGTRLKSLYGRKGRGLTFKQFVKDQVKQGNPDASEWLLNKRGACNQKRSDASIKRIALEKVATKLSRSKVKK